MPKILRIFCWGLVISFLGSLPLGTLNIAAMDIGLAEGFTQAIYFSLGSLLVEMVYVRISLVGIDWVRKQEKVMRAMEWITFAIILALAVGSFIAATKQGTTGHESPLKNINMHRFLLGMLMCAINPVQIPFWFGWSTVLFTKKILEPKNRQYNSYIIGIGIGTLLGNCVFIFGGAWLVGRIANSQQYLNWIIGGIFAITAIIQLIKLLRHKGIEEKMHKIEDQHNETIVQEN
ncbi:LysE family translocator [Ferruginibacter sp. HRS2-29]|uniref:LysE family translocator n=1 Tax=Ferruginibacter sp. HRS2-29 TaxID=2487334 RepID=UPI0020CECFF5|nr:LysE family transporter [Ferruginibacter sp. HRS2-29]MCP9749761.1 lysine transporter LysE [Ferruginibacter sp. HRS2-29]